MEDNKTTIEAENTTEANAAAEGTTEANAIAETKIATKVKKFSWKKHWKIFAIAFLALAIVAAAVVWIILANNDSEPEDSYAEILMENLSNYNLICASGISSGTLTQYWQLQSQIEKLCGVKPVAETDYIDATAFEILVGNTNREESQTFLSNLLWNDYGYAIVGNKIVIAGHTDEGTTNAMKHFLEHIKNGDHTTVFFSNKNQYLFRYPYISDTFMLNGIDVSRAKIVVNEEKGSDMQIAQSLSDKSLELCGRRPEIVTDFEVKAGDALIIIGMSSLVPDKMQAEWDAAQESTEGQFSYYINNVDNVVWINTAVLEGYRAINRDILPQIQANETASITLATGLVKVPQLFSVMSFNVYVVDHSSARTTRVIDTILENIPSVFGVQEADMQWMTALKDGLGDVYTAVGVGRDGIDKGEHSAIFYRTDMFNLVDSGTKWLSNTPDVMASKFPEANFPRIMTYAILERTTDGARFLYVNTHLDHDGKNSSEVGEQVRQRQIEVLIAEIQKLGNYPTIVTGDFNVTDQASAYTTMIADGFLDASRIAKDGEIKSTYNDRNDAFEGVIIDYIFVSPEFKDLVEEYTVCPAKRDGAWVSDHNAIIAIITLPTTESQE